MEIKKVVTDWFKKWDEGDIENLPISEDFSHSSPYGTIMGKEAYLDLVRPNKSKFLGNVITLQDELYNGDRAAVRYHLENKNEGFSMVVSEWIYAESGLIKTIHAYYQVGEIPEARKLK